jgi:hypothetical protein
MTFPLQQTVGYRTYVNTALVEALRSAFAMHPDTLLQRTKVNMAFSFQEIDYPSVVVTFIPSSNEAAGIGHQELRYDEDSQTYLKANRRLYHGTIDFRVYALSTLDRDLIADSLMQIIGMPELLAWTHRFYLRINNPDEWGRVENKVVRGHDFHFLNVNTDRISEQPPTTSPNPWGAEDVYLYETGMSIPVFGEVLSIPPDQNWTLISKVIIYPYINGLEPVPQGSDDPAPWIPV